MTLATIIDKVKTVLPHILAIIAALLGGGSMTISNNNEEQAQVVNLVQGRQVADNTIDIQVLQRRLERLEAHHD